MVHDDLFSVIKEYYNAINDMQIQYHTDYVGFSTNKEKIKNMILIDNKQQEFENKQQEFENEQQEFENEQQEFENEQQEFENEQQEFENNQERENNFFYICKNKLLNAEIAFDYFSRNFYVLYF
jgi:hypothetical protein